MGRRSYADRLRDPRWQKKRLEIMERDQWTCQLCGNKDETLTVHHRYYIPGKEPWDYPRDSLVTLCETCHGKETDEYAFAFGVLSTCLKTHFWSADIWQLVVTIDSLKPDQMREWLMFGKVEPPNG